MIKPGTFCKPTLLHFLSVSVGAHVLGTDGECQQHASSQISLWASAMDSYVCMVTGMSL